MDSKAGRHAVYNMRDLTHYNLLADLFRYPGPDFQEKLDATLLMLEAQYPSAAKTLAPFRDWMYSASEDRRQELYTKTFDVQPICYLDLGYVIFGEDYKRGSFLVHMGQAQAAAGNDCGSELSDNLSNVLTFLPLCKDEALVDELAAKILAPALKMLIAEFESSRVDLKMKVIRKMHKAIIDEDLNKGNVYRNCFEALQQVVSEDFATVIGLYNVKKEEERHGSMNESFFNRRNQVTELVNNINLD